MSAMVEPSSRCWRDSRRVGICARAGQRFLALVAILVLGFSAACNAAPAPPEQPEQSLLASAFSAIDAEEFERAHRIADEMEEPLAARTVRWFALTGQRRGGDFVKYLRFIEENPDWPWPRTLQYRAEGAMPSELPAAAVRAFFAEREPVSSYGAERLADALLAEEGMRDTARDLLRRTWVEGDFTVSDERQFHGRYGHLLDEGLHRARLERLLWEGRNANAERQILRVDADYQALARARLRLAAMQSGVDGAINSVPSALRDDPGLTFERARWRQRKGRYEDVVAMLDPPSPDAPYPEAWWPVRNWTARLALDRGDVSVAYRVAANHGLEGGVGFAQGEWMAGWAALRFLREPEQAYRHFVRLFEGVSTPVSLSRGAYWAGRAAEEMDDVEGADIWYRKAAAHGTTFYGQLAIARLDEEASPFIGGIVQPGPEERSQFDSDEIVQAVRLLIERGFSERIDNLIVHLAAGEQSPASAYLIAELAEKADRQDLAVRMARQFRRSGIILAEHLYPVVSLPGENFVVTDEARAALVLAIVRQESSFDTSAVSRAGARGLMQLMPPTARAVAGQLDLPFSSQRLLSDPEYNIRLGETYLQNLVERFDGSLLLAVAAYNAGPARVSSWLNRYGDPRTDFVDAIDWIENLPFSETRNYIQRVFEGMMVYRQRMVSAQFASGLDPEAMFHSVPLN